MFEFTQEFKRVEDGLLLYCIVGINNVDKLRIPIGVYQDIFKMREDYIKFTHAFEQDWKTWKEDKAKKQLRAIKRKRKDRNENSSGVRKVENLE